MISWLAARCDGTDYGHLFEFAFSKDRLFYGPYQIQARINQNPDISQQYSLWNQMGSKVILGNLLVFPIENALLYVEPLYIRAENGQLPELQRVIAAYSDRIVMGSNLTSALNALFSATGPNCAADHLTGVFRRGANGDDHHRGAARRPPTRATSRGPARTTIAPWPRSGPATGPSSVTRCSNSARNLASRPTRLIISQSACASMY